MPYVDRIVIEDPTLVGTENEFGQLSAGDPDVLLDSDCDVQDASFRTRVALSGDKDLSALSTVFLPESVNVLAFNIGKAVRVWRANTASTHLGKIAGVDPMNAILLVRWS